MEVLLTEAASAENPVVGDILLDRGNLVLTRDLGQEVAQRLRVRFRFFKGTWFLDRREGVPWYGEVLVKDPSPATIRAICRRVLLGCPGVAGVLRLDVSLDAGLRELDVDFDALLEDGATFRAEEYGPFLVEF